MNKEQKVNYVKCWLQKFGDRDNETFKCTSGFKHLRNNQISDRTDEELDEIINQLKSKQFFY